MGEIQTQTDPNQWRYVPTKVNPADMLSRGMPANDLAKCNSWWRGPAFLSQTEDMWPRNKIFEQPVGNNEIRRPSRVESRTQEPKVGDKTYHVGTFVAVDEGVASLLAPHKYSSWLKLNRIQAWINRFVGNCQRKGTDRISRELTVDELQQAEIQLIKQTQRAEFPEEWKSLAQGRPLPASSKLLGLKPKLDDDGLVRSDGRLKNARFLSYDVRYPVILLRKCWLTKLIIKDAYEEGNQSFGTNQILQRCRLGIGSSRHARQSENGNENVPSAAVGRLEQRNRSWHRCPWLGYRRH